MEPKIVTLDVVDCGLMRWDVFYHALETLAGPIDDDIMQQVIDLSAEPGGLYEIGRILEVDPALVLLAHGLSEGMARFFFELIED